MQKKKVHMVIALMVSLLFTMIVQGAVFGASGVSVTVNNQQLLGSSKAIVVNGVILVPAKELASALGGSFEYDNKSMSGKINYNENELIFRLDNSIAKYNGKYMQAPAPMQIIDYRFYIPAEFVSQKLGAESYMSTSRNTLMIFQPSNGKIVYQVLSGDSLWIISQLFGTSISSLKQLNGLTSDVLYVGQKLIVKNATVFGIVFPAVTTQNATLRSGAGFDYNAVNYLTLGISISVVGKNGEWYKVITPKGNGYIYYSIISLKQDLSDTASNSNYFYSQIPVDTSNDFITYTNYTVQKGDTLWYIAQNNGIPDYELTAANNISMNTPLYPGMVLKIPVHYISEKVRLGSQSGELLDWFKEAQYIFPIGKVGKFTDFQTGKSFMAKRTMGASHSDTETLTAQDSQAMKEIFGGTWTWNRRSFILEVDGRRLAVSIAGMPHAGVDGAPFLQNVNNRSDNWGYGPNYDSISRNGMDGHFDVYFLNCLRHVDNNLDPVHQYNVMVSGGLQ